METNLTKYEKDLELLIDKGDKLFTALQYLALGEAFIGSYAKIINSQKPDLLKAEQKHLLDKFLDSLPDFSKDYQGWYSEALEVIRQLIPNRVDDFVSHYRKPKPVRKDITFENYVIQDALQGLNITRGMGYDKKVIADLSAAIPRFQQQLAILGSAKKRFQSSLFDIKNLVQADLLDDEVSVARQLHKNKFYRASGAVCGVVLEKHLGVVCAQRGIEFRKKSLTISDFNEELKKQGIIETSVWRKIQFLGDIRNKCCHNKSSEPSSEEVMDLVDGTDKIIKTVF